MKGTKMGILRRHVPQFSMLLGALFFVVSMVGLAGPANASTNTAPPPSIVSGPAITGTPTVGSQLTCVATYSPNTNSVIFEWLRDGTPIVDATLGTYTLVAADSGTSMSCKVTASDGITSVTATSAAVAVTGGPSPSPSSDCQATLKGVTGSVTATPVNVTYTASLPKVACQDLTVYGDSYVLPASYDGSGSFNSSASPQQYIVSARTDLVIKAGTKTVSVTKNLGDTCPWVQSDVYKGPRQDTVTYPSGTNGFIAGKIYNVGECATATPTPTPTVTPTPTPTPTASTPTPTPSQSTSTSPPSVSTPPASTQPAFNTGVGSDGGSSPRGPLLILAAICAVAFVAMAFKPSGKHSA